MAVVLPSDDSALPDLSSLLSPTFRAALARAINTTLALNNERINAAMRDALDRQLPQLEANLALAQKVMERDREQLEARFARLQRILERDRSQFVEAVRNATAALEVETGVREHTGVATANLGGLEATAVGSTDSDVDAIAAAVQRSGDVQALVSDLLRALTRTRLVVAEAAVRVPVKQTAVVLFNALQLVAAILTVLIALGYDVSLDLTPSEAVERPELGAENLEPAEPPQGEIERYAEERVHGILEQDEEVTAPSTGAPVPETPAESGP